MLEQGIEYKILIVSALLISLIYITYIISKKSIKKTKKDKDLIGKIYKAPVYMEKGKIYKIYQLNIKPRNNIKKGEEFIIVSQKEDIYIVEKLKDLHI